MAEGKGSALARYLAWGGLVSVGSTKDRTVGGQSMIVTQCVGSAVSAQHMCVLSRDQCSDVYLHPLSQCENYCSLSSTDSGDVFS